MWTKTSNRRAILREKPVVLKGGSLRRRHKERTWLTSNSLETVVRNRLILAAGRVVVAVRGSRRTENKKNKTKTVTK